MAEAAQTPDEPQGLIRRACDQCRFRKIRCDKVIGTPCSHCRTAKRECTSTEGQKYKDTRQRVSVSHHYERKIERVEQRLAGIEEILNNLTVLTKSLSLSGTRRPVSTDTAAPTYTYPSTESSTAYETPSIDEENDETFEGTSSMTAHTVFASAFLEQAVSSPSFNQKLSPDINNALACLRQMVHLHGRQGVTYESRLAHQKPAPKGLNKLPLPPTDTVLKLLREIKAAPLVTFMRDCVFITVDGFIDYCRRVFFATEDYGTAIFIIVNAGLYFLFQEKFVMDGSTNRDYLEFHYLCRDNLETALATLPLLLPPKRETIEALLLGVTYSIEISKFTLAWQLNSAAAAMCQALGWHHIQTIEADDTNDIRLAAFWFCYMQDKALSLRFGRTSVIRDLEISAPRSFGNVSHLSEPWKHVTALWIQTGSVLGDTYDHLYSPEALARQPEARIETARHLARRRKQLFQGLEETSAALKRDAGMRMPSPVGDATDKEMGLMTVNVILKSAEVSHLACLTLIYRALPSSPGFPSSFNVECLEAARMAFKCHEECIELTSDNFFAKAGYLRWTLLYDTFAPLVVIFCHIIETSNHDDLQRLSRFAASLEPVSSMSLAMQKFYRLCKVLDQIATLYVEAKSQSYGQHDQDSSMVGNDFDTYLSQLGFIPSQQYNPSDDMAIAGGTPAPNQASTQLGVWFSGNSCIMGLMEEDLFVFGADVNSPQ
ncbi:hypothetical protein CONLIGDRAFT_593417 [Coniochaeta ligniaria NRRL 30616]|uniref:Zn(2)-C6 fungal-type domain-containing protein n=1 Tax=Coniochaeta ligniaria NRRL 30616 TaxID=1408157 RepID=A0A1J7IXP6_9PEZI|nr:hypothetical protein CONLIGDRAFT_593417 [Coniochaeta ligniaria NRRL 30616]